MSDYHHAFPEKLYHAYVIEGDPDTEGSRVLSCLIERGDVELQSPDLLVETCDSFTMDHSAIIKEWHSKKSVTSQKKICILSSKFINREAEQTLLKILEEPAENTHFFIIVPTATLLLDTIRSRTHVIHRRDHSDDSLYTEAVKFISLSPKERLDVVARLIESHKESETSGALRYGALEFLNTIEKVVYEKFKKDMSNSTIHQMLKELETARSYASTQGASIKMILEHIALML